MNRNPNGRELLTAVDRLCRGVAHWTPARWAAPGPAGDSRADAVASVVQRIADLAAVAEGQPRRIVPRLDNDLILCDQLRVVTADLVAAQPSQAALRAATILVEDVHRAL